MLVTRVTRVALVAVVALSASLLRAVPARAQEDGCPGQWIFWWMLVSGSVYHTATGEQGNVKVANRHIGACNSAWTWGMVHVELTDDGDQFETGFEKHHDGTYWFNVTKSINGGEAVLYDEPYDWSCPFMSIGESPTFRARWVSTGSGYRWQAHVQCPGSSTWTFLDDWNPATGDGQGKPMVEVGRYGSDTGLSDDHDNLQYKDTSGSWHSWPNMQCHGDTIIGWDGEKVSGAGDHFDTFTVSNDVDGC